MSEFTWRDGERLIRFGPLGPIEEPFLLLTTERAALPELTAAATEVAYVPAGKVDEISAELLERHSFAPDVLLVALGGGRVVDTTKAIAGAVGARCGAIPTTLSGAEMTAFHRTPAGVAGARLVIENPNAPPPVRAISPEDAAYRRKVGTLRIVDVRPAAERALASLPGDVLDLDHGMDAIDALPKNTPLAFLCHHGNRSHQAAEHFRQQGFLDVYNIVGGIDAWAAIDDTIAKY